jgi:hypothetical protein
MSSPHATDVVRQGGGLFLTRKIPTKRVMAFQENRIRRVDRYVGYYEPYATSHEALDSDVALQEEVRSATKILIEAVKLARAGNLPQPGDRVA